MTREIKVIVEKAGAQGIQGVQGDPGVGVPSGGDSGQVLAKIDNTDYNTEWVDQQGGGGGDTAKQLIDNDTNVVIDANIGGGDSVEVNRAINFNTHELQNVTDITSADAMNINADNGSINLNTNQGVIVTDLTSPSNMNVNADGGSINLNSANDININCNNNQGTTFRTSQDAQNNLYIRGETGGGDDVQLRIQVEPGDGSTQIVNEGSIAGNLTIQTPDNLELQSNNGNMNLNCNNGDIYFNTFIGSDIQFIDDKQVQFGEFSNDSGIVWNKPGGDSMSIKSNDEVITINGQNSNQLTVQHIAQQDQNNQLSLNSSDNGGGSLSINLNCDPASGRPQLTGDGNLLSGFDIISNNQELKLTATNGNSVEISEDSNFSMGEFFNGGKFKKVRLSELNIDCNSGSNEVTFNIIGSIQGGWNFNNMYRIRAVGINVQTEITLDAPSNVSLRVFGGDNSDTDIIGNVSTIQGGGSYNLPDFFNQGSGSNLGLYSDAGNFTGGTVDVYAIVEYLG